MNNDVTPSKRVLVLPGIENLASIVSAFPADWSIVGGRYRDIVYTIVNGSPAIHLKGVDLREFDYVWLSSAWNERDLAYAISLYLTENNVKHTPVEKSGSKVVDMMLFSLHGLPVPDTCFTIRRSLNDTTDLVRRVCGFPAISKDIYGERGRYSRLVTRRNVLDSVIKQFHPGRRFMFQRFVLNDYDWGILVVEGKVVSAEKSFGIEGEFRNNACRHAKEVFIPVDEVPDQVKSIAITAAQLLGLSWSRSDIIVDKNSGEPLMLEVNRFPGTTFGSGEVVAATQYLRGNLVLNK